MEEMKRRGRPARGEETNPQSTLCTIKDSSIEPFYIVKDASNFTVIEKSIATRGFGGKESSGKEIEKTVGHYSSFSKCLKPHCKGKILPKPG